MGKVRATLRFSLSDQQVNNPLKDTRTNKGNSTTIIVDNQATGMTGLQEHPGTGFTITGEPTFAIDYEALSKALGVKHVRKVDPYNLKETMEIIKEEVERDEPSVIITVNGPCMLHRREKRKFEHPFYTVDLDPCRRCGLCLEIGCPAISWKEVSGEEAKTKDDHKRKGIVKINRLQCPGCGLCSQICKFEAIIPGEGVKNYG